MVLEYSHKSCILFLNKLDLRTDARVCVLGGVLVFVCGVSGGGWGGWHRGISEGGV